MPPGLRRVRNLLAIIILALGILLFAVGVFSGVWSAAMFGLIIGVLAFYVLFG